MEKRLVAREIIVNFFKDAVQVSNSNLVRNANTLLTSGNAKINPDEQISWIGKSGKQEQDIDLNLRINFLFRGIKEAADLPKFLFLKSSNNVLAFGV